METRNETNTGIIGWGLVASAVVASEVIFEESLTHAFRRGLANDRYRPFLLGGMAITALHLMDKLPKPADPFVMIEAVGKAGMDAYRHMR